MIESFYQMVESNPVIAAIKDMDGLETCCSNEDIRVIFVLFGDICNIQEIVHRIQTSGKMAIVHVDLINGLSTKEIAVDFIRQYTGADGIISTKANLIRRAKELNMGTVMRFFILDSMSLENIRKQVDIFKPDFIEILPGIIPDMIREISGKFRVPVIAGGLIRTKADIIGALEAGAIAVSSTNYKVWEM